MKAENLNPPITPWVRIFSAVVALILVAGATLFIYPDLIGPRWPWDIFKTPFNTRFLGAIYLSECVTIGLLIIINRWAPSRIAFPMAITFAVVVTAVSFLHLDRFDFKRVAGWAWFVVYIAPIIVWAIYYWPRRDMPAPHAMNTPRGWQLYLWLQAAVEGIYGLGLLILPATFSAFWPWKFDDFHAQVYSSVFIVAAIGSVLVSQRAAAHDFLLMGVTQLMLGITAILSVVIVDAQNHKARWGEVGSWVWVAGFAVMALAGVAMIMRYQAMRKE